MKAASFLFLLVILILSAVGLPRLARAAAGGPSFDCAKAKPKTVEKIICRTPQLAQDDQIMANLYKELMLRLPKDSKNKYRERQIQWIVEREKTYQQWIAQDLGEEEKIYLIRYSYRERIARLKLWLERVISGHDEANLVLYRNAELGFEFLYPDDMRIVISSAPIREISIAYGPIKLLGKPTVSLTVDVSSGSLDQECMCDERGQENRCPDDVRPDIQKHSKVNGFYADTETGESAGLTTAGFAWQDFSVLHAGECFGITRMKWWQRWDTDPSETTQHLWAEIEEHYEMMLDIVKSFRFLDREPKPK